MSDLVERLNAGIAQKKFASGAYSLSPDLLGAEVTMREAAARIRELEAQLADWQASQTYRYIGIDGKPVLARALEDRAIAAEAQLAATPAPDVAGAARVLLATIHDENGPSGDILEAMGAGYEAFVKSHGVSEGQRFDMGFAAALRQIAGGDGK